MSRPHTVGVIPARYGSSRLPGKPLIDLCGKPMIQHVYERARAAKLVDRIIVATDHWQIADTIARIGGEAMMTPGDLPSGSDRIAWVAEQIPGASIIVNIQGDEPLLRSTMIDAAIQPMHADQAIQAATLVCPLTSAQDLVSPNVVKVVLDKEGFALYFSRSPIPYLREGGNPAGWTAKHHYYKHLGLYVFRRDVLLSYTQLAESGLEKAEKLEQLRLLEHGIRIKATLTEFDSVPVDTAADAERVRLLMKNSSTGMSS